VDLSGVDLDVAPPPWAKDQDRPKHDVPPPAKPRAPDVAKRIEPAKQPDKPKIPESEEPKLNPVVEAKRLSAIGMTAFRDQEYGLAAQKFNQAVESDPTASRAYFLLGQAYFAQGKYRDAIHQIAQGLGLDPTWPKNAFRPRFDIYADHPEDRQRHLQQLEDAVARQPNQAGYLFLLAYQYWFDDRRADAEKLFRQVRPLVGDPALIDLFLKADVQ
jgi:tetratricopeptide (TPR) repeat protein